VNAKVQLFKDIESGTLFH